MNTVYSPRLAPTFLLFCGAYFLSCFAGASLRYESAQKRESLAGCTVIQWDRSAFAHPYLPIDTPGKYCINQDYVLSCINGAGSCGSSPLIEITANNVDLDLQGHTLSRKGRPLEIFGRGFDISIRNGFVRNGSLRIKTPGTPNEPINGDASTIEPVLNEDSFIRVENIHFESGGIFVSGANALIRNNEIASESGDLAPICVYGPHAVIENNVLKRISTLSQFHAYGIYLRNGKSGLIRDNVIENKGSQKNTFAVGLRNSQEVKIVNNKVYNFSTTVERLGLSDEQQKGNIIR